jgi:hypothetical protein
MREKTLGLWMVRLAFTIGAGAIALGLSPAAAHASAASDVRGFTSISGAVQYVGTTHATKVQAEPIFVTEDFDWS